MKPLSCFIVALTVLAFLEPKPVFAGKPGERQADARPSSTSQVVLHPATLKDLVEMKTFLAKMQLAEEEEIFEQVKKDSLPTHGRFLREVDEIEKLKKRVEIIKKAAAESRNLAEETGAQNKAPEGNR